MKNEQLTNSIIAGLVSVQYRNNINESVMDTLEDLGSKVSTGAKKVGSWIQEKGAGAKEHGNKMVGNFRTSIQKYKDDPEYKTKINNRLIGAGTVAAGTGAVAAGGYAASRNKPSAQPIG